MRHWTWGFKGGCGPFCINPLARVRRLTATAVLVAGPLVLVAALWFGSVDLPPHDWLAAISGGGGETAREIVWGLRAPRAPLLPLAALAGGTLLTAADTLARSVVAPLEFPVGAITALVGVPVLLALLARSR